MSVFWVGELLLGRPWACLWTNSSENFSPGPAPSVQNNSRTESAGGLLILVLL